ncbi:crotonase/enoyl-CoA hydratase family protein [Novosphingobium sp. KCTC 2891]|uniref:crotonase/enoyl-CoA hydratase family protein n=1 Tax=Novosphingobium sp. KCTC 2891 TaxID=2989730 RepID=UPI0022222F24|nr:crotonase/enoyl-CoA hydratase family protein [Novosphingobium sp. KCTC 2891]MCW1383163.1 crotonase/enoyl-CoA hydratase family protein [Novosphingobium sp. KCTC 2891]
MNDRVSITIEGGVADVRLTRADKRNAFDDAMFEGINAAIAAVAADNAVRVVVVSGDGPCFSAGLDLTSFGKMVSGEFKGGSAIVDLPRSKTGANRGQQVSYGWRDLPVPVIAAVHGVALGAGFQLALGADFRFVAPDAKMSAFEMNWGLIPDMGAFPILRELVRADVARDLVYSARIVEGEEALAIGLASRVCADPRAEALAYAREIAGKNPDAIRAAKRIFNMGADSSTAELLMAESREMGALIGSPNQSEAVKARLEKREAQYA